MPVHAINISAGGIPKRGLPSCAVELRGLRGDAHNHEKHNRPEQAVCLLDLEQIEELRGEGFEVGPGATGENLTLVGAHVRHCTIGDQLLFPSGMRLEITRRREPCYVLDAIDPKLKVAAAGRLGMYARVIVAGEVVAGDCVTILRRVLLPPREVVRAVGVVLAGGASRRMGRPKHAIRIESRATAPFAGRTFAEAVAASLEPICTRVIVAGPSDVLPELMHVSDRVPARGPLAGIDAALSAIEHAPELFAGAEHALVVPCDTPLVTPALLARLLEPSAAALVGFGASPQGDALGDAVGDAVGNALGDSAGAARPRGSASRQPEPLPGRFSLAALPAVRRALESGRYAVRGLFDQLTHETIETRAAERALLLNVNTPDELTRLDSA